MSTTPQLRLRGLQPGGSNDRNSLCHNGLDDSSPVSDVEGCYEISFSLKTTGNAFESGSFRPVLPDKVALSPYPFEWNFTVFSHGYRYSDPSPVVLMLTSSIPLKLSILWSWTMLAKSLNRWKIVLSGLYVSTTFATTLTASCEESPNFSLISLYIIPWRNTLLKSFPSKAILETKLHASLNLINVSMRSYFCCSLGSSLIWRVLSTLQM